MMMNERPGERESRASGGRRARASGVASEVWNTVRADRPLHLFVGLAALVGAPFVVPALALGGASFYVNNTAELLLLAGLMATFAWTARELAPGAERRMWTLWFLAIFVWWVIRWLYLLPVATAGSTGFDLTIDVLYTACYLVIILAIETRGSPGRPQSPAGTLSMVRIAGAVTMVGFLLADLAIVPAAYNRAAYATWVPSVALYVVFDLAIGVRFLTVAAAARTVRERAVSLLLAATMFQWFLLDGSEALEYAGLFRWPGHTAWYLLWFAPMATLALAARVAARAAPVPASAVPEAPPGVDLAERLGSPLALSAVGLAVVHIIVSWIGPLDPLTLQPRRAAVLVGMVVLGGLAVVESRLLARERLRAARAVERQVAGKIIKPGMDTAQIVRRFEAERQILARLEKEAAAGELTAAVGRQEAVHALARRRRSDGGEIDVEIHGVPITMGGRLVGVFAIYQDITERLRTEEQLRRSQRLEAIGQLAGGIAHDFNNLLMVISGNLEILRSQGVGDGQGRRQIDQIARNHHQIRLQRISRLDHLFDKTSPDGAFGRQQRLSPEVINVNDVVAGARAMLRRVIGEDIELTTVFGSELWPVKADGAQIEQVLVNLVVNARDAMPQGGRIIIETDNVEIDGLHGHDGEALPAGPYVRLAVSDTGEGMDAATQARVFEPFFTTKEVGRGTGLGLSTVYGIVRQSGGMVQAYSDVGAGTTFKVYLPRAERAGEKAVPPVEPARAERRGETILLVEDEDDVRALLRDLLASRGFTVLEASDGHEGVAVGEGHDGPIHLLLTDVVMPKMGGPKVAEELRAARKGLKVLFMSGYTDRVMAERGELPEDVRLIEKPFGSQALLQAVTEALDGPGR